MVIYILNYEFYRRFLEIYHDDIQQLNIDFSDKVYSIEEIKHKLRDFGYENLTENLLNFFYCI